MRLDNVNPIANSEFLLTVEGLTTSGTPAYFTTFNGIKFQRADAEFSDGLSVAARYTEGGKTSFQNVTIGKPFDPDVDSDVIAFLNLKKDGTKFSFRVRPVKKSGTGNDAQMFRGTKAWELTGCSLVGWTWGENIDTGDGGQTVMLNIEFRVEQAEWK